MSLTFLLAESEQDAADVAALRVAVARDLTERHGRGHWSLEPTVNGVLRGLREAQVWIARGGKEAVATFQLGTRKPWAIDTSYFTAVRSPLYLTDMAVRPDLQRAGIGRRCLAETLRIAAAWPADAIRLDAYDTNAGAGDFYERCGFRPCGRVVYRGTPLRYYELVLPAARS